MKESSKSDRKTRKRSAAEATEESIAPTAETKQEDEKSGSNWLAKFLEKLDAGRKTASAVTQQQVQESDDSSDEETTEVTEPKHQRKALSYSELLFADLSEASSLMKKSHFCQMEVCEETWQQYREFMYKKYRSQVCKLKRRAQSEGDKNTSSHGD
ncbi:hypothetical protein, conserved [Babesia bigemina]|uniref:Uncharacterized protein n=1 Tax=Babesia bigemina TaxID=5866 RepID=A0A061D9G9_BABBI|nr:hypothetical protein, conserved [Babesia bigemina]CDR95574.1 hypothetical protein, conserved [Babesia bigemina]|eukprot:XP_012767760.1 hypothetical protein, conserved [Babesia bigemina]